MEFLEFFWTKYILFYQNWPNIIQDISQIAKIAFNFMLNFIFSILSFEFNFILNLCWTHNV